MILAKTETLREKYLYSELFWSTFSRIWTEYGEIRGISVQIRGHADQNNSEYGHVLRSDNFLFTVALKREI